MLSYNINISAELEGAVIFSKNAENLILCQEVLARIVRGQKFLEELKCKLFQLHGTNSMALVPDMRSVM